MTISRPNPKIRDEILPNAKIVAAPTIPRAGVASGASTPIFEISLDIQEEELKEGKYFFETQILVRKFRFQRPDTSTLSATRISTSSNSSSPRTAIASAEMSVPCGAVMPHMRQNAQRPGAVVGCPHTSQAWSSTLTLSAAAWKNPSSRAFKN